VPKAADGFAGLAAFATPAYRGPWVGVINGLPSDARTSVQPAPNRRRTTTDMEQNQ
jgi:hypothetical protein